MKSCKFCQKELIPAPSRKDVGGKTYCDVKCQQAFRTARKMQDFLDGKCVGKEMGFASGEWPRKLLAEHKGYKCASCSISEWNSLPITLEVNHIDGNALNNTIDNLEFLCPNCHSQTPTFRALNRGNCRVRRRK